MQRRFTIQIGQQSLERPFPGLTEDSTTQATLVEPSRNRVQESARHRSPGSSLGALIEAKPRARHGCSSRKQRRQRTSPGNILSRGPQGPGVAGPTIASLGHPGSASQDDDSDDMDFSVPSQWTTAPGAAFATR